MFAPVKPPRVGSNVAPVTRVLVFAARGIDPAAIPIPFSVVRLDSALDPRIDGVPPFMVTFDIVPATAFRSPASDGEIDPLTPSCHFSSAPTSGLYAFTLFVARTGLSARTFTVASRARSRLSVKSATSSCSVPARCTRRRAEAYPGALTYTR
jgi:hypothetical protein